MTDELRIPPERDLPPGRLQQRKELLVSQLSALAPTRRRRKRRLGLVLVPVAILLLAATGFTTYVLLKEPTHLDTIGCFETADPNGSVAVVNADGRHPTVICGELWRQGQIADAPPPEELAACVLETGPVGVFPSLGPNTCERLGLADLPESYLAELKRFQELKKALTAKLGECAGEEEARTIVRKELDERGYPEWVVEVGGGEHGEGFTEERPCASLTFDGNRKVVVIIPAEPPGERD